MLNQTTTLGGKTLKFLLPLAVDESAIRNRVGISTCVLCLFGGWITVGLQPVSCRLCSFPLVKAFLGHAVI